MNPKEYISREEVERCYIHRNELNSMLAIKQKDYETLNKIILNIPNYYILKSDHEKALADMGEEVLKIAKETATNVQKEFNKQETELRNKTIEECMRSIPSDKELERSFAGGYTREDNEDKLPAFQHGMRTGAFCSSKAIEALKPHPAMKLFTAEEAYELASQCWLCSKPMSSLKQAFGIKGKE